MGLMPCFVKITKKYFLRGIPKASVAGWLVVEGKLEACVKQVVNVLVK